MTSRERLLKTINGEVADRVPVTLFIQDHGHYIHQLHPEIGPLEYEKLTKALIDYQRDLGCDVFARMIFDLYHPFELVYGGLDSRHETDTWKVKNTERVEGNNLIKDTIITTPEGELTQTFVRTEQNAGTHVYCCTKKPIMCEADLDLAMKYEPKMSEEYGQMVKEKIKDIRDYIGDDGILGVWVNGGPFNGASMVMDHDELYMLFMTDPAYYEKMMAFCAERSKDYAKAFVEAGADVLLVGGNVAGGFMGADIYEQFILPYEKKYIDDMKELAPTVYHNCGEIMNLVDSYKKLGSTVVEPFSPVPLGDADLEKAVEQINGDYVVIGSVNQVDVLQKGTKEEVIEITKKTMEIGKKNGPFILQNSDFLEYGTPEENVKAFVETALANAKIE